MADLILKEAIDNDFGKEKDDMTVMVYKIHKKVLAQHEKPGGRTEDIHQGVLPEESDGAVSGKPAYDALHTGTSSGTVGNDS